MDILQNFLVAFAFSFLGSIPPGTINLTVLQLGLDEKIKIALRFSFAAAIIEYPYAWIAVKFSDYITSSTAITGNFKLLTAVIMILLGMLNLWSVRKPTPLVKKFQESGLRRGLVLGILNPMAIPFWLAITAYLTLQGWVNVTTTSGLHGYLFGVFLGAFVFLFTLTHLAKYLSRMLQSQSLIKIIPGLTLVMLGLYALIDYFL